MDRSNDNHPFALRMQIAKCRFNLHILTSGQFVSLKERSQLTITSVEENEGLIKECQIRIALLGG